MSLIDKITDFHDRFKKWKPLHWCWWFEKHGLPIPPYLIGGGAVVDQRNWIIGDDDAADPDDCTWEVGGENTARIGQAKEVNFMLRFQIAEDSGNALNNAKAQLFMNTVDNPATATWVDTVGANFCKTLASAACTDHEATIVNQMTAQAETLQNGEIVCESDETNKFSLSGNYYAEIQFNVQFTPGAGDSTDYFFWLFVNENVVTGTYNNPTCKVTTEAAGATIITPGTGSLTLTPKDLKASANLTLALDALGITGKDLTASLGVTQVIGTGSLATTGFDIQFNRTITLILDALSLTGMSLKASAAITFTLDALNLTGQNLLASLGVTQIITKVALSLSGLAVKANRILTPAIDALVLTGKDLIIGGATIITPGTGSLSITGQNLIRYINVTQVLSLNSLIITGNELIVVTATTIVIARGTLTLATKALEVITGVVSKGLQRIGTTTRLE